MILKKFALDIAISIFILSYFMIQEAESSGTKKMFFHCENDFNACYPQETNFNFTIIEDGSCRQLIEENSNMGYPEYNYISVFRNDIRILFFLNRCDCEFVELDNQHRFYNRSCNPLKIYEYECVDLHGTKEKGDFTKYFQATPCLRYVSIK